MSRPIIVLQYASQRWSRLFLGMVGIHDWLHNVIRLARVSRTPKVAATIMIELRHSPV